jgi:hypothetical protein
MAKLYPERDTAPVAELNPGDDTEDHLEVHHTTGRCRDPPDARQLCLGEYHVHSNGNMRGRLWEQTITSSGFANRTPPTTVGVSRRPC